jgi:hypothetical protein
MITGATPENAHMLKAAPELLRGVQSAIGTLDSVFAFEKSPTVSTALRQLRRALAAAQA